MLMSPKSLNRDTRHHAYYRQRRKRTKKKPSEESPSRCTRMTTDWDFFFSFFPKSASTAVLRCHRMLKEALEICYVCWTLPFDSSTRPSPKVDAHSTFPSRLQIDRSSPACSSRRAGELLFACRATHLWPSRTATLLICRGTRGGWGIPSGLNE